MDRYIDMPLNDAVPKESVPTIGGDAPPIPGDRFTPVPLRHPELTFLHRTLALDQHRRHVYRAGQLRVCIDGEECARFDPSVGGAEPFRILRSASYVEIFGEDDNGDLLPAVFPLPSPAVIEDDGVPHLWVTLEGGQTVAITIALGKGAGEDESQYSLQITYLA